MNRKLTVIILLSVLAMGGGRYYWYVTSKKDLVPTTPQVGMTTKVTASPVAQDTVSISEQESPPGFKWYRNEEWGFEFWYPSAWKEFTDKDINPYVKLSVRTHPLSPSGKYEYFSPFEVLVVTAEHMAEVENQIAKHNTSHQIVVGGRMVSQYKYIGATEYSTIMIPIGDVALLISNENQSHIEDFEKILSTFRFTK